jgi:hydrogenase-1 operon protein HyaF
MKPIPIPIRINDNMSGQGTGNVLPLLHEIKHALQKLVEQGREAIIDLGSIPMTSGDEQVLETFLGRGEVKASLDALGKSEIRETRFSGVWWIIHYNENDERMGHFIEITSMPQILKSQAEDMQAALSELNEQLLGNDHIT